MKKPSCSPRMTSLKTLVLFLILFLAGLITAPSTRAGVPVEKDLAAYLFVYFKDADHSLHFALSSDGYSFTDVNDGKPVMKGEDLAEQKGIRDPHIIRGPDNAFYLSMTDLHIFGKEKGYRTTQWQRDASKYDWGNNRALVLMKSTNLVDWSHTDLRFDKAFPGLEDVGCVWAPE